MVLVAICLLCWWCWLPLLPFVVVVVAAAVASQHRGREVDAGSHGPNYSEDDWDSTGALQTVSFREESVLPSARWP